jgi:ATP citrate (pro-S)-lyase
MRVVLLKQFVKEHFPVTPLLDYALEVEKITVSKVYDCLFSLGFDSIFFSE